MDFPAHMFLPGRTLPQVGRSWRKFSSSKVQKTSESSRPSKPWEGTRRHRAFVPDVWVDRGKIFERRYIKYKKDEAHSGKPVGVLLGCKDHVGQVWRGNTSPAGLYKYPVYYVSPLQRGIWVCTIGMKYPFGEKKYPNYCDGVRSACLGTGR